MEALLGDCAKDNDLVQVTNIDTQELTKRSLELVNHMPEFTDTNHFDLCMFGKDNSKKTNNKYMTCSTALAYLLGIEEYDEYTADKLYEYCVTNKDGVLKEMPVKVKKKKGKKNGK